VRKGTGGEDGYSGFTVRDPRSGQEHQTSLEARLRERKIERVVVVGLATDYCVKATAIDAAIRGFQTIALRAAMCAVDLQPGDGERAIAEMRLAGVQVE
jgi:nicotinamidase/pyrazinamidase